MQRGGRQARQTEQGRGGREDRQGIQGRQGRNGRRGRWGRAGKAGFHVLFAFVDGFDIKKGSGRGGIARRYIMIQDDRACAFLQP